MLLVVNDLYSVTGFGDSEILRGPQAENWRVPVEVIIYFEASPETLTKRLIGRAASSGRADDNEETIKLRIKTFLENNDQVLAQLPAKIKRIDAEANVDVIFAQVQEILDPLMASAAAN
ncbi:hypothetical protein evm_014243 [Chilo suppressalis]|nr:hypothetical protein evm_014243 [Chilo suppressalis]